MVVRPDFRPEFAEIVTGWTLHDDFADITDRIERLARFCRDNGGIAASTEYERTTVALLIQVQCERADNEGKFDELFAAIMARPPHG